MPSSLPRIINTDWPALATAWGVPIALIVTWVHPMFFRSAKASVSPHWLLLHVGIPLACFCLSILLWRVVRIRRLFRSGVSVVGTITALRLTKDRGRLEFSYVIDGVTHETWQPVHQSRDVLALEPGQKVSLLVSPHDSSVAIVRHLFE